MENQPQALDENLPAAHTNEHTVGASREVPVPDTEAHLPDATDANTRTETPANGHAVAASEPPAMVHMTTTNEEERGEVKGVQVVEEPQFTRHVVKADPETHSNALLSASHPDETARVPSSSTLCASPVPSHTAPVAMSHLDQTAHVPSSALRASVVPSRSAPAAATCTPPPTCDSVAYGHSSLSCGDATDVHSGSPPPTVVRPSSSPPPACVTSLSHPKIPDVYGATVASSSSHRTSPITRTSYPSSSSSASPSGRQLVKDDRRVFAYHTGAPSMLRTDIQESEEDPAWYKHRRHVLIFTFSGKPVYTRFGSEEGISGLTGTLSAIVSKMSVFFADRPDRLRYMSAGKRKFSFLEKGPLWLVSVSSTGDTIEDQVSLLDRIYHQIVTILTTSIESTLHSRPNYDLRHLLGGTDNVIRNLIRWCTHDLVLLLEGFEPLPMPPQVRNVATESLRGVRIPNLIFGAIIVEQRVVAMVTNRNYVISATDFSVVLNLILSSASQRSDDLCFWTPVCLVHLNPKAFAYAFIQFINDTNVGILFLSAASDGDHFHAISQQAKHVKHILLSSNALDVILQAAKESPISMKAIQKQSKVILGTVTAGPYTHLLDKIIHAAFFVPQTQQFFSTALNASPKKRKHIIRKYGACNKLLAEAKMPAQICVATDHECFFVWHTTEFRIYMCVPKGISTNVIPAFYQWVRKQELYIFLGVPTW